MARWQHANQRAQWFQGKYPGDPINPNVLVVHTTEGGSWPSYSGGASAPHFTARPNRKKKKLVWRQHFDTRRSARALRNESGGVETNTLNCVQLELVGTCDKRSADKYGWVFYPDAMDWILRDVADFVKWLHGRHDEFPIKNDAGLWLPYPESYGSTRARLSMAEWRNKTYGIVGHQHVPENSHGDPGAMGNEIDRIVKFARGDTKPQGDGKPDQKATLVQKARGLLKDALRDADGHGYKRRERKIKAALKDLPKR